MVQEIALLFDRRELGVTLIDDEVEQRVADALVGDVHHGRPFALPFVVAELDVRDFGVPKLCLEPVLAKIALRQADRVLPVFEVVDPVVEVVEFADHQRFLMSWRASGVAKSVSWSAISRSSMSSRVLCSDL